MKKIIPLCMTLLILIGCKEEVDTSARYVFTERTIASYLDDHQQYSEYVRLLKEQQRRRPRRPRKRRPDLPRACPSCRKIT